MMKKKDTKNGKFKCHILSQRSVTKTTIQMKGKFSRKFKTIQTIFFNNGNSDTAYLQMHLQKSPGVGINHLIDYHQHLV
jgi:hypothetical protein